MNTPINSRWVLRGLDPAHHTIKVTRVENEHVHWEHVHPRNAYGYTDREEFIANYDEIPITSLQYETVRYVQESDWSNFVSATYGRPYVFQQQEGCKERGTWQLKVPRIPCYDHPETEIPEDRKSREHCMGVSFEAWLKRDPHKPLENQKADYELDLYWERNFYPDVDMIANDLHAKGLLPAGVYVINIDW